MSGRRVVVSGAAVAAIVLGAAWYSVQAFPLRSDQLPAEALTGVAGPLERQAKQITPENPVTRRTHSVPAVQPAGLSEAGAGGTVVLRVTVDEGGRVAETRIANILFRRGNQMALQLSGPTRESLDRMMNASARTTPNEQSEMQRAAHFIDAMMTSAVQAVQQWQYAPPADAPIAFDVPVHFGAPPPPPPPPPSSRAVGRMPPPPPPPPPATSRRPGLMPPPPPPPPGQTSADAGDPAMRVGGDIKAPTKVKHVSPAYPQDAQDARAQGVVIIEARIERDGTVSRARVLRSIPMLDEAAVDAVQQWEFTPTVVNGTAVPVIMTVTVNFTLQ